MWILKELKSGASNPQRPMRRGGNRKPRTYSICPRCLCIYGPLARHARRYCSRACTIEAQRTGRTRLRRPTSSARRAHGLVNYHIKAGNLARPLACEVCGITGKRIEAAHFNYDEPLRVRWLCRSCHVRWDKVDPKGGTVIVQRGEKFTGRKAERASASGEVGQEGHAPGELAALE